MYLKSAYRNICRSARDLWTKGSTYLTISFSKFRYPHPYPHPTASALLESQVTLNANGCNNRRAVRQESSAAGKQCGRKAVQHESSSAGKQRSRNVVAVKHHAQNVSPHSQCIEEQFVKLLTRILQQGVRTKEVSSRSNRRTAFSSSAFTRN